MKHHDVVPLDRDKLYLVPRGEAMRCAQQAVDAVQRETPEQMIAGLALAFYLACRRCRLDPHDMHSLAGRLYRDEQFHLHANIARQSTEDFFGLRAMGEEVVAA